MTRDPLIELAECVERLSGNARNQALAWDTPPTVRERARVRADTYADCARRARELAETSAPAATRSDPPPVGSDASQGTPSGEREGRDGARHLCPTCGSDDPNTCKLNHHHHPWSVVPRAVGRRYCCRDPFHHNREEGQ